MNESENDPRRQKSWMRAIGEIVLEGGVELLVGGIGMLVAAILIVGAIFIGRVWWVAAITVTVLLFGLAWAVVRFAKSRGR